MIRNRARKRVSPVMTQTRRSLKERNQTVSQAVENIERARRSPIEGQLGKLMNPMIRAMNLNLNLDRMRLQIG
jgi:hypothetical protein